MKQQGVTRKLRDIGPEVEWKDANLTRMDLLRGIIRERENCEHNIGGAGGTFQLAALRGKRKAL